MHINRSSHDLHENHFAGEKELYVTATTAGFAEEAKEAGAILEKDEKGHKIQRPEFPAFITCLLFDSGS